MDFDKPIFDKVIFDKVILDDVIFDDVINFPQNCSVFPIPVLRDRRLDLRDVSKTDF
jgi:hypothetical protein